MYMMLPPRINEKGFLGGAAQNTSDAAVEEFAVDKRKKCAV